MWPPFKQSFLISVSLSQQLVQLNSEEQTYLLSVFSKKQPEQSISLSNAEQDLELPIPQKSLRKVCGPSAPAPSFLYPASNLDWQFISYMILYMF